MKQHHYFNSKYKADHGGDLSVKKRRSKRPINIKKPLHLVLKSNLATKKRMLTNHKPLILKILNKFSKRFRVKVYEKAICSNHIHLLVRGKARVDIQNFFRVVAGHIAQEILRIFPLEIQLKKESQKKDLGCKKNQRKFWSLLLYTRIVSWGTDFKNVSAYVVQNTLETMGLVALKFRNRSWIVGPSP